MNYDKWILRATEQINDIPYNSIFVLKDLFIGTEWNNLERGEKLSLGRYFKNQVLEHKMSGITYIGKAANNSAQYKKLSA